MACPNMCSAPVHSMHAWRRGGRPSVLITLCMHAERCMPAIEMVFLDTVVRVWGAGRAGHSPKLISSRSASAPQTCLKWAVRAGMSTLPPHQNSPSRSFACPLGCAMPGGRSGGCESVLIHRFHPWHTVRAYACHTTNGPRILRGLVRRPGTTTIALEGGLLGDLALGL